MSKNNPWDVDSIQAFTFLKCPECNFDSKDEENFQDHAIENHPLSFVFFGKICEEENFDDDYTCEENNFLPLISPDICLLYTSDAADE